MAIAAVLACVLTVSACSAVGVVADEPTPTRTTAPTTEPTPAPMNTAEATGLSDMREAQYEKAIGVFPYALPPGYVFPTRAPAYDWPANVAAVADGSKVAASWWGCAMLEAGWAAIAKGDGTSAEALFAAVTEAVQTDPAFAGWETGVPVTPLAIDHPEAPRAGNSGLCLQWFTLLADAGS